jgi:hypothetical protein
MNDVQRDPPPKADKDPAAKIIEQWIKLREAQGDTQACRDIEVRRPTTTFALVSFVLT